MTPSPVQSIAPPRPVPRRVLVLGSTGMVGRSWVELLIDREIAHDAVSRPDFDLLGPESIDRCVSGDYDLVVNAAAWTDVDGAEEHENRATAANAEAVERIARRCTEMDAVLVSYSTDYVFAGDGDSPYRVDGPVSPVNAYGRSKAEGERRLRAVGSEHLLIRTSWVYAPWGKNFVRTIRGLARDRDELRVVDDQRGRPTSAQHLASGSLELYLKGGGGVWHLCDDGECSWHELACAIIDHDGSACRVDPCTSAEFPRPAKRPGYSTLDLTETIDLIGRPGHWCENLRSVLRAEHS